MIFYHIYASAYPLYSRGVLYHDTYVWIRTNRNFLPGQRVPQHVSGLADRAGPDSRRRHAERHGSLSRPDWEIHGPFAEGQIHRRHAGYS